MISPLMLYALLTLTFATRILDGISHGLHWYSRPRRDTGEIYHTVDLFQTFAFRALYFFILYGQFKLSISFAILWLGIVTIDQAVWQMFLNKFSGNGFLSGELDSAGFSVFGYKFESNKTFRNKGRIIQLIGGVCLVILAIT